MAYESQIGTYHLGENPQLYEPQRTNNFEFIVTNLDGILRPGPAGDETDGVFRNAQEILRVSVSSASVPHFSQEPLSVKRGNSTIKFAGTPSFGDGEVLFRDYIGANTKEILMAWQNLSYNVYTEKVSALARTNYKRDAYLIEYPPDFAAPIRRWVLHGCWVSNINEENFDNESNNLKLVTCTIPYDWAALDTVENLASY